MDVERDETPAEKADRNWIELLQELRVAQTGIQILAGFLLTIPFSQRFGDMPDGYRKLYLACFALAAIETGLLIEPVTFHRFLYGQHATDVTCPAVPHAGYPQITLTSGQTTLKCAAAAR